MATRKRKFTPAQVAAQKLFAQRSRSGQLRAKSRSKAAQTRKASVARKASPRKTVRRPNPVSAKSKPARYEVHFVDETGHSRSRVAVFDKRDYAMVYAKALANTGHRVGVLLKP